MNQSKRLATLEAQSGASMHNDLNDWICVAMPGAEPGTFNMRQQDGTAHTITAAQLAAIAQANATDNASSVIILDR